MQRLVRLLVGGLLAAALTLGFVQAGTGADARRLDAAGTSAGAASVPRLGYVGRVEGTRAFVGIVVRGSEVTAYVCDGRKLSRWFRGSLSDGRALLRSASGGRLEFRIAGGARGVLRIPGRKAAPFVAVAARGRAGLFRAERTVTRSGRPAKVLSGWVRLNDGAVRGASVTSSYRVLRPRPGVEVVLLAQPGGQVGPPLGAPTGSLRQTATATGPCDLIQAVTRDGKRVSLTTRGCGLPLAGLAPPTGAGPKVTVRPVDFRLSENALGVFAAGLPGFAARERAGLLSLAGQREPAISPAARGKLNGEAAAMLLDRKLLDAAGGLRGASPADVLARKEAFRLAAKVYTDRAKAALAGAVSSLVAIYSFADLQPVRFPVEQVYLGPWAETHNIQSTGDQWEVSDDGVAICHDQACAPLFAGLGAATNVGAHARAGFNSSVTYQKSRLLIFDVPAGAGQVEVEIEDDDTRVVTTEDCFGRATALAGWGDDIFLVRSDGTVDPVNDTPVTGGWVISLFSFFSSQDNCGLTFAPAVPAPPTFQTETSSMLTFTAPPGGGTYLLAVTAEAHADVLLGGTAVAQVELKVDKVTVRHG